MKTRKDELQDLYYAIKQDLLKRGRKLETAMSVATNMVCRVEQDKNMTIKDIRAIRDTFLKGEKLIRPKKFKTEIKETWNGTCWVWNIKTSLVKKIRLIKGENKALLLMI